MTAVKLLARTSSGTGASRPVPKPRRHVNSKLETMVFTREDVSRWEMPDCQRPLRVNDKVRALAEELKQTDGILTGVITLGVLPNDKTIYLVDGQHRREAFKMSGLKEAMSDVRTCMFDDEAHLAEEFVRLQQSLVSMRPDDTLRGLEASTRSLKVIRETCAFVGYDKQRRSAEHAPFLSMTLVLRSWSGSQGETPTRHGSKSSPLQLAREIDDLELTNLCKFLHVAHAAWSRDVENARLWAGLNMSMCMWLYRRLVLNQDRTTAKRAMTLSTDQFKKCLMGVSADDAYIDWLSARVLNDHSRNPCYTRIKKAFTKRLKEDHVTDAPKFPSPAWAVS